MPNQIVLDAPISAWNKTPSRHNSFHHHPQAVTSYSRSWSFANWLDCWELLPLPFRRTANKSYLPGLVHSPHTHKLGWMEFVRSLWHLSDDNNMMRWTLWMLKLGRLCLSIVPLPTTMIMMTTSGLISHWMANPHNPPRLSVSHHGHASGRRLPPPPDIVTRNTVTTIHFLVMKLVCSCCVCLISFGSCHWLYSSLSPGHPAALTFRLLSWRRLLFREMACTRLCLL